MSVSNAISLLRLLPLLAPSLASAQFRYFQLVDSAGQPTYAFAPKTLSATGLYGRFTNLKNKPLIAAAIRFDVNSALWSDGSHKLRWILLKPGTSIPYNDTTDYYDYPDSAVFIKQFAIDTTDGDTTSRVLWETRLLVNKKELADSATGKMADKWYGYSYKWKRDGTDAVLVDIEGENDTINTHPEGVGASKPMWRKKWRYPGQRDCWRCHVYQYDFEKDLHGRSVLGFFTAQLNRPYWRCGNGGQPAGNQLDTLFARTVFKVGSTPKPANWNNSPRWWSPADQPSNDPRDSVGNRARAYIAANCSGCHSPRGIWFGAPGHVTFDYNFQNPKTTTFDFRDKFVTRASIIPRYWPDQAAFEDSIKLVKAGHPEWSLLLARQLVRNTLPADSLGSFDFYSGDQMPPLASFEINKDAETVLTKWIKDMPKLVGVRPGTRAELLSPTIQGQRLILPPGLAAAGAKVVMFGLQGRAFTLHKTGAYEFAIPAGLPSGIYIIKVGSRSFTRYLF